MNIKMIIFTLAFLEALILPDFEYDTWFEKANFSQLDYNDLYSQINNCDHQEAYNQINKSFGHWTELNEKCLVINFLELEKKKEEQIEFQYNFKTPIQLYLYCYHLEENQCFFSFFGVDNNDQAFYQIYNVEVKNLNSMMPAELNIDIDEKNQDKFYFEEQIEQEFRDLFTKFKEENKKLNDIQLKLMEIKENEKNSKFKLDLNQKPADQTTNKNLKGKKFTSCVINKKEDKSIKGKERQTINNDNQKNEQNEIISPQSSHPTYLFNEMENPYNMESHIYTEPDNMESHIYTEPDNMESHIYTDSDNMESHIYTGPDNMESHICKDPDNMESHIYTDFKDDFNYKEKESFIAESSIYEQNNQNEKNLVKNSSIEKEEKQMFQSQINEGINELTKEQISLNSLVSSNQNNDNLEKGELNKDLNKNDNKQIIVDKELNGKQLKDQLNKNSKTQTISIDNQKFSYIIKNDKPEQQKITSLQSTQAHIPKKDNQNQSLQESKKPNINQQIQFDNSEEPETEKYFFGDFKNIPNNSIPLDQQFPLSNEIFQQKNQDQSKNQSNLINDINSIGNQGEITNSQYNINLFPNIGNNELSTSDIVEVPSINDEYKVKQNEIKSKTEVKEEPYLLFGDLTENKELKKSIILDEQENQNKNFNDKSELPISQNKEQAKYPPTNNQQNLGSNIQLNDFFKDMDMKKSEIFDISGQDKEEKDILKDLKWIDQTEVGKKNTKSQINIIKEKEVQKQKKDFAFKKWKENLKNKKQEDKEKLNNTKDKFQISNIQTNEKKIKFDQKERKFISDIKEYQKKYLQIKNNKISNLFENQQHSNINNQKEKENNQNQNSEKLLEAKENKNNDKNENDQVQNQNIASLQSNSKINGNNDIQNQQKNNENKILDDKSKVQEELQKKQNLNKNHQINSNLIQEKSLLTGKLNQIQEQTQVDQQINQTKHNQTIQDIKSNLEKNLKNQISKKAEYQIEAQLLNQQTGNPNTEININKQHNSQTLKSENQNEVININKKEIENKINNDDQTLLKTKGLYQNRNQHFNNDNIESKNVESFNQPQGIKKDMNQQKDNADSILLKNKYQNQNVKVIDEKTIKAYYQSKKIQKKEKKNIIIRILEAIKNFFVRMLG